MMSTQAIAIDAMLPAFPAIVGALKVGNPNHGQWIVTAYMAGLGTGQLVWGLLSDRFGRRPIVLGGMALYVVAALVCGLTRSFEALLAWRFVHGLAAASATVVRSIVRDLYSGRQMARVLSLTFVVFLTVPVLAPSLGQAILWMASWRYIFIACGVFASIVWLCAFLRLPETLHPEYRLPLDPSHIFRAVRLVVLNRISMFYTLATTVLFGSLIAYVGMVQQIFADVFHRPAIMPLMFALCAGFMGVAAFTNSRLVGRLGMRLISHSAMLVFIAVSRAACRDRGARLGAAIGPSWCFRPRRWRRSACRCRISAPWRWSRSERSRESAHRCRAASRRASAAIVAAVIGREFNGTTLPLATGSLCCGLVALGFVLAAERGRLFRRQHHGSG